jgi:hypothetical protein
VVGNRQRARDLAIVLLAELAAMLAGHRDRVGHFLGKPVSSTILALIAPSSSFDSRTSSRRLASAVRRTLGPRLVPRKCSSDWYCATHLNQGEGCGFAAHLYRACCVGRQFEAPRGLAFLPASMGLHLARDQAQAPRRKPIGTLYAC